eukprot:CAMPEP_0196719970 /NCGR_PEP_ID=MMETSP1091-20130531/2861_1 /TAXON_ID=302021 /ORGANISM="Rhodomonas sp., Strain CCMP768" /LENGTH=69 /DNA_ID=CAMNT_0042061067 /DNA_START=236 /DNA_END=442 /DNA_ORIENTATION=+
MLSPLLPPATGTSLDALTFSEDGRAEKDASSPGKQGGESAGELETPRVDAVTTLRHVHDLRSRLVFGTW